MSPTILVLDDDAVIRDLISEVLQDEGFQVVAAESLTEMLKVAPEHADLLITDFWINFQALGLRAIEQMRQATRSDLPAIICTAALKESEDHKAEITQLGAQLLLKPFTIDEFLDLVNRALKPAVPDRPQTALQVRTAWA
jgi:two-component system nitrogen regulation response regulator NtrX